MVVIANFLKIILSLFVPFWHSCLNRIKIFYIWLSLQIHTWLFILKKLKSIVHHAHHLLYSVVSKRKRFLFYFFHFHTGEHSFRCWVFFSLDIGYWSLLRDRTKCTSSCSRILDMWPKAKYLYCCFVLLICFFSQFPLMCYVLLIFFWWAFFFLDSLSTFKADAACDEYFTLGVLILVWTPRSFSIFIILKLLPL